LPEALIATGLLSQGLQPGQNQQLVIADGCSGFHFLDNAKLTEWRGERYPSLARVRFIRQDNSRFDH
jgi:hypothetical protein